MRNSRWQRLMPLLKKCAIAFSMKSRASRRPLYTPTPAAQAETTTRRWHTIFKRRSGPWSSDESTRYVQILRYYAWYAVILFAVTIPGRQQFHDEHGR